MKNNVVLIDVDAGDSFDNIKDLEICLKLKSKRDVDQHIGYISVTI